MDSWDYCITTSRDSPKAEAAASNSRTGGLISARTTLNWGDQNEQQSSPGRSIALLPSSLGSTAGITVNWLTSPPFVSLHAPSPSVPLHQDTIPSRPHKALLSPYTQLQASVRGTVASLHPGKLLRQRLQPAIAGLVALLLLVQHQSEAAKLGRSVHLKDLSLCSLRHWVALRQSL